MYDAIGATKEKPGKKARSMAGVEGRVGEPGRRGRRRDAWYMDSKTMLTTATSNNVHDRSNDSLGDVLTQQHTLKRTREATPGS